MPAKSTNRPARGRPPAALSAARALLAAALRDLNLSRAYAAGTLDPADRRAVLHVLIAAGEARVRELADGLAGTDGTAVAGRSEPVPLGGRSATAGADSTVVVADPVDFSQANAAAFAGKHKPLPPGGHWITTHDHRHVYIGGHGETPAGAGHAPSGPHVGGPATLEAETEHRAAAGRKAFEPWYDSLPAAKRQRVDAHLASKAETIHSREIATPLTGERFTAEVRTNPYHGLIPEEKRYAVRLLRDGEVDDHVGVSDRAKAIKVADRMYKGVEREARDQEERVAKARALAARDPARAKDEAAFLRHLADRARREKFHRRAREHEALANVHDPGGAGFADDAMLADPVDFAGPAGSSGGPADPATFALPAAVARWRDATASHLRSLYLAGTLALLGPADLTAEDLRALDRATAGQVEYLDNFAGQVAGGEQAPGGVAGRAVLYAHAAWGVVQAVERERHDGGDGEERRVLASSEHCNTCVEQAGLGWQPAGTLNAIGDSECRSRCKCHFIYRDGGSGDAADEGFAMAGSRTTDLAITPPVDFSDRPAVDTGIVVTQSIDIWWDDAAGTSPATAGFAKGKLPPGGRWVTIEHRPVYVKGGKVLAGAGATPGHPKSVAQVTGNAGAAGPGAADLPDDLRPDRVGRLRVDESLTNDELRNFREEFPHAELEDIPIAGKLREKVESKLEHWRRAEPHEVEKVRKVLSLDAIPPPIVAEYGKGGNVGVPDGFHRIAAALLLGRASIRGYVLR